MGGSSSQPAATLLVGSPHFDVPVAATSEEAQLHALAKISSLLASKEALERLCNDLFQNVSDDGCGGGVSRSGLRMLTHLVIDGCQVSDPAALHELLDVLAPLPSSGSEGGDDDAPRLGYEGFVCYARCMLRVVDAALRSEVGAAAAGHPGLLPPASSTAVVSAAAARRTTASAEFAAKVAADGAFLPEAVTPAAKPVFPLAVSADTLAATPTAPPAVALLGVPSPVLTAVTPMSTPATCLTPPAPARYSLGSVRPARPSSPLQVGRATSPSRAVRELRSVTPPRLGVRPPLRRPNVSPEKVPNTTGGALGGSTSSSSTPLISNGAPSSWASGFVQCCRPASTTPVRSGYVSPAAASTTASQQVRPAPSRSAGHVSSGERGRIPDGLSVDAACSPPLGSSRPPRSLSPRRRISGPPLPAGGLVVASAASSSVLLARAAPPPISLMQQSGRSDVSRHSLSAGSRSEGGSLASSASVPELTGYPAMERSKRCPPAFPPPSVRGGSLGGAGGGCGWKGSEASVVGFSFKGAPNSSNSFTVAKDHASAPGAALDTAQGTNGASCKSGIKTNVADPLAWNAMAVGNGSCESTPPSGLSDVPDVLRQHLDRRKAQLQSMQQRLAKLSHECDSLQGMVKATE